MGRSEGSPVVDSKTEPLSSLTLNPESWRYKMSLYLILIYLAALGLSCSTWALQSLLQHAGSLVTACELLTVACGIWFPDQGLNLGPLHWERGV